VPGLSTVPAGTPTKPVMTKPITPTPKPALPPASTQPTVKPAFPPSGHPG
jgi:hypothetical protein